MFRRLVDALRGGALVPLLADRDLTTTGIEPGPGHAARVAPGPAAAGGGDGVRAVSL